MMGLLGDDFLSYQFDMAIISRGIEWEAKQRDEAEAIEKRKAEPPMSINSFVSKMESGEIPIEK